jgi:DegV family protein with EDD domain
MVVRIVTDSTADLPTQVAQELGIAVVPLTVFFGDEAFLDGVEIDRDTFYARLAESKALPRTSQPSPAKFVEAYQRLIAEGADAILAIQVAGKLSGTIQAARTAIGLLPEGTRQIPIELLDSNSVSDGLGYMVQHASKLAQAEKSLEEIRSEVEDIASRTHIFAVLDTLEFLRRGGRIGAASAFLGNLLSFKPILSVDEGEVHPVERPRTRSKAYARVAQLLADVGELEHAAIVASNDEVGEQLREAVQGVYKGSVPLYAFGAVVGTHAGPGVAGVAYVTKKN